MSVPFSNTHLRIPRGFGTILNGLVREVLRDQPEDIPEYAAQYFSSLLTQRKESGVDPAEWAAKLEDRFYNNAFQDMEASAIGGMSGTKTTTYKGKSNESKTGEESSHSREVSSFSTIQENVSEGSNLIEGTTEEKEEEKHDTTERLTPKGNLSEVESVNRELDADEPSGAAEQDHLRILDSDNKKAIDRVVDHPDSEFTGISLGFLDDVACVSPPTAAEDEGSEQERVLDKNIVDSNEKTEAEEQAEVFHHSECPGINVLEATFEEKDAMEGSAATSDRQQEGHEKPQHEDASLPSFESLKSEYERPEDNKRQAEDQAQTTEKLERLQTCSEETHGRFSNIDDSNADEVDSSVEVSFEDLSEAQETKEFEDRQPEEQDAVEVSLANMEILPVEESKETAAVSPDQKVSVTQDREHEMAGVEMEANLEGKKMKSQREASVMKERVDTSDPNLSDEEDEMGEDNKVVGSLDQPTGTPESDKPEYENGRTSSLKISEGESQQKDPNSEEAETTDVQNGDEEHVSKEGYYKGGAENQSPQASQSNSSTGAPETETETSETSVHHLSEEDNGGQGTALKAEAEVTVLEEDPAEPLDVVEERTYASETQEDSRTSVEDSQTSVKDSVNPDPPADEGEKGHSGKDAICPEDGSGEKQEDCSRPQEEEDIMDIPLDDPEANRAAAKIQAGFRGHMTRKKLKPEDKAEGEERQDDRGQ